jgi:hypothetical protein
MQAAIDATDIDRGPIVNNQIEVALYFILFVVIFSFFFINIFVALIILTFQDEKEKEQGDCELERNQVRTVLSRSPGRTILFVHFTVTAEDNLNYTKFIYIDKSVLNCCLRGERSTNHCVARRNY